MKPKEEPKNLMRLIANLSNDTDIQLASELKAVRESLATEDPSIELLKQRVLRAARLALATGDAEHEKQTCQSEETATEQTSKMITPFPRWSGRTNLPKGFEAFINSGADIPSAQEECLAIAADSPASTFWTKVLRVLDLDMRLLLSAQPEPGELELIVTDSTGAPSSALDGARLISPSGSIIAEITERSAVLDAAMLKNDFIMISPTGSPLTLKPE